MTHITPSVVPITGYSIYIFDTIVCGKINGKKGCVFGIWTSQNR